MRIGNEHWLINKPIAHRGLWDENVPENSRQAYELAAKKGYPIEIDLYMTKDGKIVSFHDATLDRMTEGTGFIYEKTYEELSKLHLSGAEQKILTLEEVLEICKGKSPILVEIKDQPNTSHVDKIVKILKGYDGEFAVQAFNPLYVRRIKKLAPEFIRGILTDSASKTPKWFNRFVVKRMPLNFLIKPDFISRNFSGYPLSNRKTKNKALLAWTVTDINTERHVLKFADNIIYELYVPEKYKK